MDWGLPTIFWRCPGRRFLVRAFARRRPHSSLVYGRALDRNTHQSPLGNRCWSGWSGPGTGQKLSWRCPGLRFPSLCLGALLPGQCVSLRGFAIQAGGRQTLAQVDFVFSWKLFLGRCGGSGIGHYLMVVPRALVSLTCSRAPPP